MKAEDRYDSLIQFYAGLYGMDWLLLKSQIKQESAFDPDAKSKAGAVGLAQFMPLTWKEWQDGTPGIQPIEIVKEGKLLAQKLLDARDPEDCIKAQAAYMQWLIKFMKSQDLRVILAAYNWGCGNVIKLLAKSGMNVDKYIFGLPAETQTYIKNITKYYSQYKSEMIK